MERVIIMLDSLLPLQLGKSTIHIQDYWSMTIPVITSILTLQLTSLTLWYLRFCLCMTFLKFHLSQVEHTALVTCTVGLRHTKVLCSYVQIADIWSYNHWWQWQVEENYDDSVESAYIYSSNIMIVWWLYDDDMVMTWWFYDDDIIMIWRW